MTEETKQEMNPGDYVIDKRSVGKVIGRASDGRYVVEWFLDEIDFVAYKEDELVKIDVNMEDDDAEVV